MEGSRFRNVRSDTALQADSVQFPPRADVLSGAGATKIGHVKGDTAAMACWVDASVGKDLRLDVDASHPVSYINNEQSFLKSPG